MWVIQRRKEVDFQLAHYGSLCLNQKFDELKLNKKLSIWDVSISGCWGREEVTNGRLTEASKNRYLPHFTVCQIF